MRQFRALLRKNFLLQTRTRKGSSGWYGLVLAVGFPCLCFALPALLGSGGTVNIPESLSIAADLDSAGWATGPPGTVVLLHVGLCSLHGWMSQLLNIDNNESEMTDSSSLVFGEFVSSMS